MSKPTRPQPPHVYRPNPVPKVLQRKTANGLQTPTPRPQPVAPAVYRPQPGPKVLQAKAAPPHGPGNQSSRTPAAPPVYRPQPTPKVLQRQTAVGQQTRPDAAAAHRTPKAAPAAFGPPATPRVVQPKPAGGGNVRPPLNGGQPAPPAVRVPRQAAQAPGAANTVQMKPHGAAPPRAFAQGRPGPRGVVQLTPVKLYDEKQATQPGYLNYIEDYESIQKILTDKDYYIPALKALNQEVEARVKLCGDKRALSSVLLKREQMYGINQNGAPIYTAGLSAADFIRMTEQGVIPKDVGETSRHGEQTHRIQWYVVLWHMYAGFKITTPDKPASPFHHSAKDLLQNSTRIRIPANHFPMSRNNTFVWDALFDRGFETVDSWGEDGLTSADMLGLALHGATTHLAHRAHPNVAPTGVLTSEAPEVARLLLKNYNKRYNAEQTLGTAAHLGQYEQKKLQDPKYEQPHWSQGHIFVPVPEKKEEREYDISSHSTSSSWT